MLRKAVIAAAAVTMVAHTFLTAAPASSATMRTTSTKSCDKRDRIQNSLPLGTAIARIGRDTIYQSDFEMFLQHYLDDQQRLQIQSDNNSREQMLDEFLRLKIMAAKAQKDNIHNTPACAGEIAIARVEILAQALIKRDLPIIEARSVATDDEVKNYFNANKEKFTKPETFSARHILVSNRDANNESKLLTDDEVQNKISKIQDELNRGRSFADVARDYSDDPGSKDEGGLCKDIAFGKFATKFEQAVRSQDIGKVGAPIKTQYGYHLIEVIEITPATIKTFDESKDIARKLVINERRELEMNKYFHNLAKEVGYKKISRDVSK